MRSSDLARRYQERARHDGQPAAQRARLAAEPARRAARRHQPRPRPGGGVLPRQRERRLAQAGVVSGPYTGADGGFEPLGFAPDGTLDVRTGAGHDKAALYRFDLAAGVHAAQPLVALGDYDFDGSLVIADNKLLGVQVLTDARGTLWFDAGMRLMHTGGWGARSDLPDAYQQYGMPELIGDMLKDATQLAATSPLAQASRIRQRLLLACGGADQRVPFYHGARFHDDIKPTNPHVEMVVYDDQGHGWARSKNRIDFWSRVEKLLDKHIGRPARR